MLIKSADDQSAFIAQLEKAATGPRAAATVINLETTHFGEGG